MEDKPGSRLSDESVEAEEEGHKLLQFPEVKKPNIEDVYCLWMEHSVPGLCVSVTEYTGNSVQEKAVTPVIHKGVKRSMVVNVENLGPVSCILGEYVMGCDGRQRRTADMEKAGVTLLVLFAGYWHDESKQFTKSLIAWWQAREAETRQNMRVLVCSSDFEEDIFQCYLQCLPNEWYCVPWEEPANAPSKLLRLAIKYGMAIQPDLIFVDGHTGNITYRNGRELINGKVDVLETPRKSAFSLPLFIQQLTLMRSPLCRASPSEGIDGPLYDLVYGDCLEGKYIIFFFATLHFSTCAAVDNALRRLQKSLTIKGIPIEVIYINCDSEPSLPSSIDNFASMFPHMPYLALCPDDKPALGILMDYFEVNRVPKVVVLDRKHNLTTLHGAPRVWNDPEGLEFPWQARPVMGLHFYHMDYVNERQCLIIFTDGTLEQMDYSRRVLAPVATPYFENKFVYNHEWDLFFFYTTEDTALRDELMFTLGVTGLVPFVLLVDVPRQRYFPLPGLPKVAPDSKRIATFVAAVLAHDVTPVPFLTEYEGVRALQVV